MYPAFVNINGVLISESAAAYWDFRQDFNTHFGLIETLLAESGRLPHWHGHRYRLQISFEALGWSFRKEWPEQIYREILALLAVNQLTGRTKLRLLIFRTSCTIHYLIETFDFPFKKEKDAFKSGSCPEYYGSYR